MLRRVLDPLRPRLALCPVLAAWMSCTGAIKTEDGHASDSSAGVSAKGGSSASGGSASSDANSPSTKQGPDTPLRRLTRSEFRNTIRDLFGLSDDVAALIPADPRAAVFSNQASLFKSDETTLETFRLAIAGVAEKALDPANVGNSRWRVCDLAKGAECARTMLQGLLRRAWRRKAEPMEVDAMLALAQSAVTGGDSWNTGMSLAVSAILLSPHFLFRVERAAPDGRIHPVSADELAVRLSYFLWSSMPDDPLFARADDSSLLDPKVMKQEIARMLNDPKAAALQTDFAAQWLDIGELDVGRQDAGLSSAMKQETFTYLGAFFRGDTDFLNVFDAGYSYVNDTLAKVYGIASPGASFAKVNLDGKRRVGLLTQPSVIATASLADRSSPTRRGKWFLSRIMCSPPPPPPANVDTSIASTEKKLADPDNATMREKLQVHRDNPVCRSCHAVIDPPGFAFEHYDQTGAWRDQEQTGKSLRPIDATGEIDGVGSFNGAVELSKLLKNSPAVSRCISELVYTYALGRPADHPSDRQAVDVLATEFDRGGRFFRDLVVGVATQSSFLSKGGNQ